MKPVQLLLVQASVAAAAAIYRPLDIQSKDVRFENKAKFVRDQSDFQVHDTRVESNNKEVRSDSAALEPRSIAERAIGGVKGLSHDGSGDSHEHSCVVFRSLEWLAFSLIEETEQISSKSGEHIYVDPAKQSGSLAVSSLCQDPVMRRRPAC